MSQENERRALRAASVLTNAKYYVPGLDWYSAVSDVLKDLQHLADLHSLDFLDVVDMATESYLDELHEDRS